MIYEILNEEGGFANRIEADQAFVEQHYPERWRLIDSPPAPEVRPRHVTKLAFRNRFTVAEKVAIDLASIDNPAGDMAARQQSAAVRVSLADAAAASYIDLARDDTRAGVLLLEGAGVLGAGRAAEILDAEILESERAQ